MGPDAGWSPPSDFNWWTTSRGTPYARGTSLFKSDPTAVERIRTLSLGGKTVGEIAKEVKHDPRTVAKVLGRGVPHHGGHGGVRKDVLGDEGRVLLWKLIRLFPRAGNAWYAKCMSKMLGKRVGIGVVRLAWKRFLRFSAHTPTVLYSEGLTEKVYLEQKAFLAFYKARLESDPRFGDKTFFIDATSFNQVSLARRGKALGPIGGVVLGEARSDRGANWDFVGAINRVRGLVGPYVYEGHVDADVIEAWFEHVLLPQLEEGDWIVLDGASYWSGRNVVEEQLWPLCEDAGVSLLWLPTRSPWFNPIEKFNGWLKDEVAKDVDFGKAPRDNMTEAIHTTLDRRTDRLADLCRGWIDFLFAT